MVLPCPSLKRTDDSTAIVWRIVAADGLGHVSEREWLAKANRYAYSIHCNHLLFGYQSCLCCCADSNNFCISGNRILGETLTSLA
ncbi:hypothetical protein GQ55_9G043200 [Panicum hallii var. hallii]|uniref:Uncharacterized protein n=1 Tax=Panicum hallii var. hallii TaxID=1504633 RepID=A0A2T7BZI6_9POAL|nr:hypothetical protein GQ55_9G043200 [Panicum hallii var. hallii]